MKRALLVILFFALGNASDAFLLLRLSQADNQTVQAFLERYPDLPFADRVEVTEIRESFEGDTFAPAVDRSPVMVAADSSFLHGFGPDGPGPTSPLTVARRTPAFSHRSMTSSRRWAARRSSIRSTCSRS